MQLARNERPDLLLLDVHMPAGEGFSVQQRIDGIDSMQAIPVIYLTGDQSRQISRDARKAGAFAVIYKPIDKGQLLATIRSALSGSGPIYDLGIA